MPWLTIRLRPSGFELLARFDQLFPLPVDGAVLFLLLARHPHHRERFLVSFHEAIQFQAECLGVAPVGFDPFILLIELLRTDHLAADPKGGELAFASQSQSRTLRRERESVLPGSAL